jgi:diguanylate cyclase (GGDEF)-like protein
VIVAVGLLVTTTIVGLFGLDLYRSYQAEIDEAKRYAQGYAQVLAEHTARSFEAIDRTLQEAEAIRRETGTGRYSTIDQANVALRHLRQSSPLIVVVGWTDANGNLMAHSYDQKPPRPNISELPYFKLQRDAQPSDSLVLSPPFRAVASGGWITAASRRLTNPDGSFAGVATATLDQSYFQQTYRSIGLGPNSAVLLLHRSGAIFAREPMIDKMVGQSYASGPLLTSHVPRSEIGAYETVSVVDGVPRVTGYKVVPGLPLIVLVSLDRQQVLKGWWEHLRWYGPLVLLVLLLNWAGVVLLVRTTRRLATKSQLLTGTLEAMSQGLCVFDQTKNVVVSNKKYGALYGLSPEEIQAGTSLAQIIDRRIAKGLYSGPSGEAYRKERQQAAITATTEITELNDGRVLAISRQPLGNGSWITTHQDISDLRRAEIEVQHAHQRLLTVINAMPAGLVIFDADDRLVLWNKHQHEMFPNTAHLRVVGLRWEEMIRAGVASGHYFDAVGREAKWIADRIAMHRQKHAVTEDRMADGRWFRHEHFRAEDGSHIGVRVEITEAKKREQRLHEQNARFDAALRNMSQGLSMFDQDQRLVVCNDQYLEMYRMPADHVRPGCDLRSILKLRQDAGNFTHDIDRYVADLTSRLAQKQTVAVTTTLADGRTVAVVNQPMLDGGWVATHEDISERTRTEVQIAHMAHHDALTDLANRSLLRERIEQALLVLRRQELTFAILVLDLDRFKAVNDSLGHAIGDALLKEVAERLKANTRDVDVVARLGGDEFAIFQRGDIDTKIGAGVLALRLLKALGAPYEIEGQEIEIGTSIGIALAPDDSVNASELLKYADLAMYKVKAEGRNGYRFFNPEFDSEARTRRALEQDLREALSRSQFELHYQPLVNLRTEEVVGYEALLRWRHPERGLVLPDDFVGYAEETALIEPIGEWVLREACSAAIQWSDHIRISVNLSAVQFRKKHLVDAVIFALAESGLAANRLELEITESVLLEHTSQNIEMLHELRRLGVRIVLDDFGTGFSSLLYLQQFPFNKIKIDRSFVSEMPGNASSSAIVCAINSLAQSLDIITLAEGVETAEQARLLKLSGCGEAQGFLFGKPLESHELCLKSRIVVTKT